jgi:hypothetical protein
MEEKPISVRLVSFDLVRHGFWILRSLAFLRYGARADSCVQSRGESEAQGPAYLDWLSGNDPGKTRSVYLGSNGDA